MADYSELIKVSVSGDHERFHMTKDGESRHDDHGHEDGDPEVENDLAANHPHTIALTPVYRTLFDREREDIVGVLLSVISFDNYMENILPEGIDDTMEVVLWNTCDQMFTYHLDGPDVSTIC